MGVVYKLKPEIVDFIVQQKKEDPSLSCRALAEITEERFQQRVSKSSINNLLKDFKLSSPVGRRGPSKKAKARGVRQKFSLSEAKKKELFSAVSQHRSAAPAKGRPLMEGMTEGAGSIFLKAAEWELSHQPVLQDILQEYCPGLTEKNTYDMACLVSYLKVFHVGSSEDLQKNTVPLLWELRGADKQGLLQQVQTFLSQISKKDEFFLKFSLKIPQIFTQVLGFRYILKDGESFFIDGQNASIWKNIQTIFPTTLSSATERLAKIINNANFACFCSILPKNIEKFDGNSIFSNFFKCFNNVQSKKIQKIDIIAENGDILAEFDNIPQIKRDFIAAVWPWDDMFQVFLNSKDIVCEGKIDNHVAGKDISYKEMMIKWKCDGSLMPVRGVGIIEPFSNVPALVVISNMGPEKISARDLGRQYFQRWPNVENGTCFSLLTKPAQWKAGLSAAKMPEAPFLPEKFFGRDPLWMAVDQLSILLDRFSRRRFFPEHYHDLDFETMNHRFYHLPGRVIEDGQRMVVDIQAPEASVYFRDFLSAARRLNESNVKNFSGKQVSINIL